MSAFVESNKLWSLATYIGRQSSVGITPILRANESSFFSLSCSARVCLFISSYDGPHPERMMAAIKDMTIYMGFIFSVVVN